MEERNRPSFSSKQSMSEIKRSLGNSYNFNAHSGILNYSDEECAISPKRRRTSEINSSYNSLFGLNETESLPTSPWEWRKMQSETISLKNKVSHQETTIQQLHKVRKEMEEVFNNEKKVLEIQIEQDRNMIKQLELRVENGRKSCQEAKLAQARAENDLSQLRAKMEHKIMALIDDNTRLSDELRRCMNKERRSKTPLVSDNKVEELQEKLSLENTRVQELEVKLRDARSIQQQYELQNVEIQNLKIKLADLESQKEIWEEGKKLTSKVSRMYELERELQQCHQLICTLRESVKGKLLLEEQIADMEHKLKQNEKLEKEIIQSEIKMADLQEKLCQYESIGIIGGPQAIKWELNRLQQAETLLLAEEGQLRSRADALERELNSLQAKYDEAMKTDGDKIITIDRMTRLVSRLQKKMLLLTRERDSYKQQVELLEREMASETSNATSAQERIPALEKVIEGYKDLVSRLENDIENLDKGPREENKKLKEELEKLKDELEHRALKGDFNVNSRILHFKMNPLALAAEQAEEKQRAMVQELEELRKIVASGNVRISTGTSSLHAQEIAELQQKHEIKIDRLKEAFKASSHEYRQACYQLFGWRVDRTKEGQYKLSSQYADSPDDYLFFIVDDDGVNMIETPFSSTLTTFIERHLAGQHSVPMFLNAVQCDLFEQQTAMIIQ